MKNTSVKNIADFSVDFLSEPQPISWNEKFKINGPVTVEIGFGRGEFLIDQAKKNPSQNFIGIEIKKSLVIKLSKRILAEKLNNILLLHCDAQVAIERLFKQRSIHRLYALFPFPWPKKKHHRYRLFQKKFLKILNSRLKNKKEVIIVTDYDPYSRWIMGQARNTSFRILSKQIQSNFNTHFEVKWKNEGQKNFYKICLIKHDHINIPTPKPVCLKPIKIKSFDPNNFLPKTKIKKSHIIFKKYIFDNFQKIAIQNVLLIEGALVQKLQINIKKTKQGWEIAPDKQVKIFNTPGVRESMQEIKKACLQSTN